MDVGGRKPAADRGSASTFQVERNRLEVLLSQVRPGLTSADFRELLQMQIRCDDVLRLKPLARTVLQSWLDRLRLELDGLYGRLASGEFHRRHLRGLIQLYGEIIQNRWETPSGRSSETKGP